jgi:hypothetical protein
MGGAGFMCLEYVSDQKPGCDSPPQAGPDVSDSQFVYRCGPDIAKARNPPGGYHEETR